jgi:uracil-DNA glycosylase family 4
LTLVEVRRAIVACEKCPRLREYCARVAREKRAAYREDSYWGQPVPGFGDEAARLLVLGLAPAAHGGNRTGRVFTGDGSGDFLMAALHTAGFASQPTSRHVDDGLVLRDAYIAAAVRCAPPGNKPAPEEIANCAPHLEAELSALARVVVILALGRVASDAYWRLARARGVAGSRPGFRHGGAFVPEAPGMPALVESYHPSRQNTNTGRLTAAMLTDAVLRARDLMGRLGPAQGRRPPADFTSMGAARETWSPSLGDRRIGLDRRSYSRGGRRRSDWPKEIGAHHCPRCGSPELRFVDATPGLYFWDCHRCRFDWSTRSGGTGATG